MKLVVGNMLVLLFASKKMKILFRKTAEFVGWVFWGLDFLVFGILLSVLYFSSLLGSLWEKLFYCSLEA